MRKDLTEERSQSQGSADAQSPSRARDDPEDVDQPLSKRLRGSPLDEGRVSPSSEDVEAPGVSPAVVKDEVVRPDTPRPGFREDQDSKPKDEPIGHSR